MTDPTLHLKNCSKLARQLSKQNATNTAGRPARLSAKHQAGNSVPVAKTKRPWSAGKGHYRGRDQGWTVATMALSTPSGITRASRASERYGTRCPRRANRSRFRKRSREVCRISHPCLVPHQSRAQVYPASLSRNAPTSAPARLLWLRIRSLFRC